MPRILNLDQVGPKDIRQLKIGGKTYDVKEMSVATFIESSKLAESMEGETSFSKQMEMSVRLIKLAIPEMDDEVLTRLSMEQLAAVSRFIRGDDMGAAEEGGEQGKA